MRSFGFRLILPVAILWTGIGSTARALGHHDAIETVYVMPSAVSLPVPTSYVVSTSWVEPTGYSVPTAYALPTAYAVPTYYTTAYWTDPLAVAQPTYVATSYVRRRGLFGRRWVVERPVLTSYVPTTYVASRPAYRSTSYVVSDPLLVPSAYVAANDCPCPTAIASAAPTYASPSRSTGASGTATRPRSITSEADNRASRNSNVGPPPDDLNPAVGTGAGDNLSTPTEMPDIPSQVGDTSPPPPPAPAEARPRANVPGAANPQGGAAGGAQGTANPAQTGGPANVRPRTGTNPAAGSGSAGTTGPAGNAAGNAGTGSNAGAAAPPAAPAAPADELGTPPPIGPQGEIRSQSMKPSTYSVRRVPSEFRNVLVGTVNSRDAGGPEEDVRVNLRNLQTGATKSAMTNAFGRFAVRLADGDWAVDVTMPSGRVYEVSRLQVGGGEIVDNLGRRVPSLDITR